MEYSLDLNPQAFEAIKKGTKRIEGRVPTEHNKHVPFDKLKPRDIIIFTNNENKEIMNVRVLGVRHYKDVKSMLEAEGTRNVLSNQGTVEEGIESYHSIRSYKENIEKHGIYAIEIAI